MRTTPSTISKTGAEVQDAEWDAVKADHPDLWVDTKLKAAGMAYAGLIEAQRTAFLVDNFGKSKRANIDFGGERRLNFAVLSAWAFTLAGVLHSNSVRLERHFALKDQTGKDPLNAAALAKGRHKSDPENYRGLGYRTDAKERARFVELFYLHAEKGGGITSGLVDLAIKKFHAKVAALEVLRASEKA